MSGYSRGPGPDPLEQVCATLIVMTVVYLPVILALLLV